MIQRHVIQIDYQGDLGYVNLVENNSGGFCSSDDVQKLEELNKEMLEALIEVYPYFRLKSDPANFFISEKIKNIIEKATGMTIDEVLL